MTGAAAPISDERYAVSAIFRCLLKEGLGWYLHSKGAGVKFLETKLKLRWVPIEEKEIQSLVDSSASQFPAGKMIVVMPPDRHVDPVVGVWCRWNFDGHMGDCHFYLGIWSKEDASNGFEKVYSYVGYRFESPHEGVGHDYFHCQPCRNLGARSDPEPVAVWTSEVGPTFALRASNNVELALNLVLALRGRKGLLEFKRELYRSDLGLRTNKPLSTAFARLLREVEPYVSEAAVAAAVAAGVAAAADAGKGASA